ncbi:hypothetical protein AAIR98_001301 [Elusimicrobium simillimum]|uniref:hypothetical protein n=1 Tax=Elusimicrobium simillimum TaxID=3143438 RepID=UPI003C701C8F
MKKIIFILLIFPLLISCNTSNRKEIKKEVYLLLLKVQNRNNRFLSISGEKLYYQFSINYAGHLILTKDNEIIFKGPDKKEINRIIEKQIDNEVGELVEVKNLTKKELEIYSSRHKDLLCYDPPLEGNCIYNEPYKPGTEKFADHVWNQIVVKGPFGGFWEYIEIDPKIGRKLAKKGVAEIDPADYKKLYKYIKWKPEDSVYYVDQNATECLYKKGTRMRRLPGANISELQWGDPYPVEIEQKEAPPCNFK